MAFTYRQIVKHFFAVVDNKFTYRNVLRNLEIFPICCVSSVYSESTQPAYTHREGKGDRTDLL